MRLMTLVDRLFGGPPPAPPPGRRSTDEDLPDGLQDSGTLKGYLVSIDRVKRRMVLRPEPNPGPSRRLRVMEGVALAGLQEGMHVAIRLERWGDRIWVTSIERPLS